MNENSSGRILTERLVVNIFTQVSVSCLEKVNNENYVTQHEWAQHDKDVNNHLPAFCEVTAGIFTWCSLNNSLILSETRDTSILDERHFMDGHSDLTGASCTSLSLPVLVSLDGMQPLISHDVYPAE